MLAPAVVIQLRDFNQLAQHGRACAVIERRQAWAFGRQALR
jgi:hypothetical protein